MHAGVFVAGLHMPAFADADVCCQQSQHDGSITLLQGGLESARHGFGGQHRVGLQTLKRQRRVGIGMTVIVRIGGGTG